MKSNSDSVLIHIVLISFLETASAEARQEIYDMYQEIAEKCGGKNAGILYFKVEWNLDLRKGVHLVEVAVFSSNESLQAFRVHPAHAELTNKLRDLADWKVGDFHDASGAFATGEVV